MSSITSLPFYGPTVSGTSSLQAVSPMASINPLHYQHTSQVQQQYTLSPENAQIISQISLAYQAYQIPQESPTNFNQDDPNAVVSLKACGTVQNE